MEILDGASNFGIGVDIESVERFVNLDRAKDSALLRRLFTQGELEYCFSKRKAGAHLAARYAAKEAVIKALASLNRPSINYGEIEVVNDGKGVPLVRINRAGFGDLQVCLSLSHCKDEAIAFTIVTPGKGYPEG